MFLIVIALSRAPVQSLELKEEKIILLAATAGGDFARVVAKPQQSTRRLSRSRALLHYALAGIRVHGQIGRVSLHIEDAGPMKLVRFGPAGQERPGLADSDGRIRDLSAHVRDIA